MRLHIALIASLAMALGCSTNRTDTAETPAPAVATPDPRPAPPGNATGPIGDARSPNEQGTVGQPGTGRWPASGGTADVPADEGFLEAAASDGLAQVALARLALERSRSEHVRALARNLLREHAHATVELEQTAAVAGADIQERMLPIHQRTLQRVSGLRNEALDRELVSAVVELHHASLRLYEDQAQTGRDMRLRTFAADMAVRVREHLALARAVAQRIEEPEALGAP